jgi:hypothetical protein
LDGREALAEALVCFFLGGIASLDSMWSFFIFPALDLNGKRRIVI